MVVPCKEDYFHFLSKESQLLEFLLSLLSYVSTLTSWVWSHYRFHCIFWNYVIKLRDECLIMADVCSFQVHGSITSGFKGHSRVALGVPSISSPLWVPLYLDYQDIFHILNYIRFHSAIVNQYQKAFCLHPASSIIRFCSCWQIRVFINLLTL